ncbi:acetyl-CoA synthetase-like protein [Aspergillus campestris IBT 28561]|uniref:Acetyl-CoA synthetase-like protein n=1 Tax=Aspergillus campestris (strain IBT 28561) TaxID=1392248 RepID=A0A2I1CTQ2_ASPC2|nr:acetyl-CoA synthetase-like protein [Aspergillus campestris IBT 28561]PKY01012.1 acetyl-CoA synthetase-like protein [Aspergillus campestris IBT 28561]
MLGDQGASDYPLIIACGIGEQSIAIHAMFDSNVMSLEFSRSMIHQLSYTLGQISQRPGACLRDIHGINPEDLERSIKWNSSHKTEKCNKCVHHLFEQRCNERPSAPAIRAWDGELTYNELHNEASCLASALVKANVEPEKLVFILSEKSLWTVVALLGILKAGGGFALLDPSQPTDRLTAMCKLTSPHLILASRQHAAKASLLGPPVSILEDMEVRDTNTVSVDWPCERPCQAEGHHVLFASFTSGSTGEPKGVLVEHAAFTSSLEIPGVSRESYMLQFASYNFSAGITEHLTALIRGACLCIPSEKKLENNMEEAISELGPTWAVLTPSVARVIDPKAVPSIKHLLLAGEQISRSEVSKWEKHVALYALYGQTEYGCAIMATPISSTSDLSTLGTPGSGTGWIVDPKDHNRLMPLGAEGELVLQGSCIARCYVKNEEQTRNTFIKPTWRQRVGFEEHCRFLKTGDIFSRSPVDGSFQYRGRKDRTVKIRGQRMELAEVEYHLAAQFPEKPNVCTEIVYPSDGGPQCGMLVAVIPTAPGSGGTTDTFRLIAHDGAFVRRVKTVMENMRKVLPSYMMPSSFISVTSLPRTASGKIHRKLLIETISRLSRRELLTYLSAPKAFKPPTTETEAVLQSLIAKVLSEDPECIGMDDQFLALGGDSLSARQLVALARTEGLSIKVSDCFQQPDVTSLARCAQTCHAVSRKPVPDWKGFDPLRSLREDFLRHLPEQLTVSNIEDVVPTREMQLFLVQYGIMDYIPIRISGRLDPLQLRLACQGLVKNHTILRTTFVPFRDNHVQVVLKQVELPWTEFTEPPDNYDPDMWAHSVCAMDRRAYQTNETFVKFILLQDDRTQQHTLIMRANHGQFDGLCLETILSDLAKLYENKPLNIQATYADYVRKCAELRTTQSLRFWTELLNGSSPTNLPLSPSKNHQQPVCIVASRDLPTTSPLPRGFTWATVVKAAWSYVLRQKTERNDLMFCQITNCRFVGIPGQERILGPCLNPIPVRVRYKAQSTVRDLLSAVQRQHVDSMDYHTLEWGDIVANCTEWNNDTEIDSIVLHENIDANPVTRVGDAVWQVLAHSVDNPPEKTVYLYTYPQRNSLFVVLIMSSEFGCRADAEGLVGMFCSAVTSFVNNPDMSLCCMDG